MSKEYLTYEQGWRDAFDRIADYVEQEVCIVTAQMIRRMRDETWRFSSEHEKPGSDHEAEIEEEGKDH